MKDKLGIVGSIWFCIMS